MGYDPEIHHRRSVRLRDYDYAYAGAYFLTACAHERRCLFGKIVDNAMQLTEAGRITQATLEDLPRRFAGVLLDEHVTMPNHVHAIVVLVGAQPIAPTTRPNARPLVTYSEPDPRSFGRGRGEAGEGAIHRAPTAEGDRAVMLGEVVRTFKAVTTRAIRVAGYPEFGWQRNYYEHVVRGEEDLNRIRQYIVDNPARWAEDEENPDNDSTGRGRINP